MELTFGSCRIRVDFGFPAVLALLYLYADADLLLQTFAVCMLHEIGHGAAMFLTGAGIREIRLYAAGIHMQTQSNLLSKPSEILILLCGPFVNFVAAFFLWYKFGFCDAVILHLGMGSFNLLPFSVLDGGGVLGCLLENHRRLLYLRTVLCLLLSAVAVYFVLADVCRNPCLLLMAVYLSAAQLQVDKKEGMW